MQDHESNPDAVQKGIAIFLSLTATIIASFYFSASAITYTISGGQPSSLGIEYLLCVLAPIPAVAAYVFGYSRLLRSSGINTRCIGSAAIGLVVSYIIMTLFGGVVSAPNKIGQYKMKWMTLSEEGYLQSALEGKFNDREIKEHYQKIELTDSVMQELRFFLYKSIQSSGGGFAVNVKPESLPVLVEVFQKRPDFVGLLAGCREAPYSLKLKVSDSLEPDAVKYLANSVDTPPEILAKLASHPSREIAASAIDRLKVLSERK